ncbi:type VI secretion protein IcmF/TssM N-terminal domain-containing protein [Pseudomonas putida]
MNLTHQLERNAARLARFPGLSRPPAYRAAALFLVVAGLVGLYLFVRYAVPILPLGFWRLFAFCLSALAVLWWFLRGARRFSQHGRARRQLGDLGPGNPDEECQPLQRMQLELAHARHMIARSPDMARGRNPLYRTPWFLFIGDQQSQVAALLASASKVSPFPSPKREAEDDPHWRWWFFKSMIAIESHWCLVSEPNQRLERGLWYQALQLLAGDRERLPLNGLVVCVGADSLLQQPDAIRAVAMRLRRLTDEALEHLQVQMPIYLVVTGLERLPGCEAFCAALPGRVLERALGHRLPADATISAATSARFDELYDPIVQRLQALRMSVLREQRDPRGRNAIWSFVDSLIRLGPGLHNLVTLMLEDNPFQRTPQWRGLYFTASGTAESGLAAQGAFIADLFTRLLPADQPLASPSLRGNSRRIASAAVGVLALLGLSVLFSAGLSDVHRDDGRLLQQTRLACQEQSDHGAAARVGWLAKCGRTIEHLESDAATSIGLGLRQADTDIGRLKSQVIQEFSNLILAPYDQLLESDLKSGQIGLEHILALSQRLRLLDHCRRRNAACTDELAGNVTFDAQGRLFGPFVAGEQDPQADRNHAADLLTTYLGYLRWQRSQVLDAEASRLKGWLAQGLALYRPTPDDVRQWASKRYDPLLLTDFWLPADQVVGVDEDTLAQVPAGFTSFVWQHVLTPMLDSSEAYAPAAATELEGFRSAYLSAYLQEWSRFQGQFFSGIDLWRGRYDALTRRAASHENPYRALFRETQRNLDALPLNQPLSARWQRAWASARLDWLDAWHPLAVFVSEAFAGWFGNPKSLDAPPWWLAQQHALAQLREQGSLYASAYLRLQQQGNDQELYRVAAELFRSGGQQGEYATLLQRFDKPDEAYAKQFTATDLDAWQAMSGPARLLVFLTLRRTGEFIEQHWQNNVLGALRNLPAAQQLDALYGEKGKLAAFVHDWLAPFVSEGERAPVQVAGLALPLNPSYRAMIASEQRLQPVLNSHVPFPVGNFQFTRASQFGSLDEGPQGTQLEVDCKDRVYSATSKAESLADARTRVYWSPEQCPEARLRIALPLPEPVALPTATSPDSPAPAPAAPPTPGARLTRIYSGAEGFLRLLDEFRDGSRSLRIADFRGAYSAAQWQTLQPQLAGLTNVRVYLSIQPSDELKRFLSARNTPTSVPTSILE